MTDDCIHESKGETRTSEEDTTTIEEEKNDLNESSNGEFREFRRK